MLGKIPMLDLTPEIEGLLPQITEAIERVLKSGQFVLGREGAQFEGDASRYLNVAHAIGLNSGTDALIIALRALDVGPGDEVITSPFSFFATAEAISLVGATPVFADILPKCFTIDPETISVTRKTKAIIPVHLFGRSANMDGVLSVATKAGIPVVEDAAQAFGGAWKNRKLGSLGSFGCFSFFPSKNLGAYGDAGMVVTNDSALAEMARKLRTHGTHGAGRRYHNEILGYNSRLDEIQAAILRVKFPHLDTMNSARRVAAQRYTELLAQIPDVECPEASADHVYHQYTIRVKKGKRDAVADFLNSVGISSMIYYPVPIHRLPVYRALKASCPIAEAASREVLSLPIWPQITLETQKRVANSIAHAMSIEGATVRQPERSDEFANPSL